MPDRRSAALVEAPLEPELARQFGMAHGCSITVQALKGLHRTLPGWLLASAAIVAIRPKVTGRPVGRRDVAAVGAVACGVQATWIAGFAAVSGFRTTWRLRRRLSSHNMIPLQITDNDGSLVLACAHYQPVAGTWYVDGVFAWPRHRGGGAAVTAELCRRADTHGIALTLTALSPTVADRYRRVGFRDVLWIYLMRREPANYS